VWEGVVSSPVFTAVGLWEGAVLPHPWIFSPMTLIQQQQLGSQVQQVENSVWAKCMGCLRGQKCVWATAQTVPAPMPICQNIDPVQVILLHRLSICASVVRDTANCHYRTTSKGQE